MKTRISPKNLFFQNTWAWALAACAAFALRLGYGLCKFAGEDELQVYLLGLKYYTAGLFPHWGADVTHNQSQLPGGLLGLLVGQPFFAWPAPEAPYVLLNLLSFAGLAFFGWYLGRRVPGVPRWFLWGWLFTAPWTLHYSTHVENPSYVLLPAILFFVAAFELLPVYAARIVAPLRAFFLMGLGFGAVFQLHMSAVLLLPWLLAVVYIWRRTPGVLFRGIASMLAGAAVPSLALWPTVAAYGRDWVGTAGQNVVFRPANAVYLLDIPLKFFSLASYEVARFLGPDTAARLAWVARWPWVAPVVLFLLVAGFAQVGFFIAALFRPNPAAEWRWVRGLTVATVALVCGRYIFAATRPAAHAFYIVLPVVFWYAFYCFAPLFRRVAVRRLAAALLVAGLVFQALLSWSRLPGYSLFAHRARVAAALRTRDYTRLALRRESTFDLARREDPWTRESLPDGRLRFTTGFEYRNRYFQPQNIVRGTAGRAGYVCKIDSLQPYSTGLRRPWTALPRVKTVEFTCILNGSDPAPLLLVLDVKNGQETVHWQGLPLAPAAPGAWEPRTVRFALPDTFTVEPTHLAVYAWQNIPGSAVGYLDDVSIRFEPWPEDAAGRSPNTALRGSLMNHRDARAVRRGN